MKSSTPKAMFDRPIPGESLTTPPKSMPYERPPVYTDPQEGLKAIWKQLTDTDTAAQIGAVMDRGMYASDVANMILKGGVATGKWSPDVALLMAKPVLASVVAVADQVGVKDFGYVRPSRKKRQLQEAVYSTPTRKELEASGRVVAKDDTIPLDLENMVIEEYDTNWEGPFLRGDGPPESLENEAILTKPEYKGDTLPPSLENEPVVTRDR